MATPPRFFEDGSYYHVYNRGSRKQSIFFNYYEYKRFLEKIVKYKNKYPINILAYCLMPNHFHFLLQQVGSNSISSFISDLCNSHSRYLNVKYDSVGSIFQGRFKAKRVDKDEYLIHLSRYIHLNPVEILDYPGLKNPEEILYYKWSSFSAYLNGRKDEITDPEFILNYFSKKNPVDDYKNFVLSNFQIVINPIIEHLVFNS